MKPNAVYDLRKVWIAMKKNIIIAVLALMLAVTATGCGKTESGNSTLVGNGVESTVNKNKDKAEEKKEEKTEQKDEQPTEAPSVQEQLDTFAENADKEIDMDKIEGTVFKTDNSGKRGDGKMTTCNVKIDEVKVAEVDGSNVVFVQFNFKNTTNAELNFAGEVFAEAYQDGMELPAAVFPEEIEGFSPNTTAQKVEGGKSIKVQKAYITSEPNAPIEIYVRDTYDETGKTYLSQVFLAK